MAGRRQGRLVVTSVPRPDEPREPIYSEGEPILWMPAVRFTTARIAKHTAWTGHGIPWGFAEAGAGVRLKDLAVSRVWMKSMGQQNGYDEWWQECSVTDVADCEMFYRVEPAARAAA